MDSPLLKAGDKFVYTKEMNDAKLKSIYNDNYSELFGKEVTVVVINYDYNYYCLDGNLGTFLFSVIDPFLPQRKPATPPKEKVTWNDVSISNNGIIIDGDEITIDDTSKTYDEWRALSSKMTMAFKRRKVLLSRND